MMCYNNIISRRLLLIMNRKGNTMDKKDIYYTIQQVADFLGLKYHHTRKLLLADSELECYGYGRKKLWKLSDIIAFKERHLLVA